MKHFARILVVALVGGAAGFAQAQISIQNVQRDTAAEIHYTNGTQTVQHDVNTDPGPYFMDLDVTEGDQHVRSIHDSDVALAGNTLGVSGSFLDTLSTADPSVINVLNANADIIVSFIPAESSTAVLDVTIPAGGEVFFFDTTASDYSYDHQGPGHFTLDRPLTPGHEYLFQVNSGADLVPGGDTQVVASATFSLTVTQDPVADVNASWSEVKALYRR